MSFSPAGIASNVDSAVQQSLEVIRKRVDQVGVAEPTIQRVGPNRVLVQLPGAQDPSHLRELLGSTAKMSFHLLADNADPNNPGPRRHHLEGRSRQQLPGSRPYRTLGRPPDRCARQLRSEHA